MALTQDETYLERPWTLSKLFLKLECVGFCGPQTHIAMANDEAVGYRRWLVNEGLERGGGQSIFEGRETSRAWGIAAAAIPLSQTTFLQMILFLENEKKRHV